VLIPGQVGLPSPDLGRPEKLRRLAKTADEYVDLFDLPDLSPRGEVPDLHVIDHAAAKWGHDQLLCEMSGAT